MRRTTFDDNCSFEEAFTQRLVDAVAPMCAAHGLELNLVATAGGRSKGAIDRGMQSTVGDVILYKDRKMHATADIKVERRASPNMFVEILSNAYLGHYPDTDTRGRAGQLKTKLGWAATIGVDYLWYAFSDVGAMAMLDFRLLRDWLNEQVPERGRKPRWSTFPIVAQATHEQLNLTMGALVPFRDIPERAWRGRNCALTLPADGGEGRLVGREEFLALLPRQRAAA